jgi:hypothetical protein
MYLIDCPDTEFFLGWGRVPEDHSDHLVCYGRTLRVHPEVLKHRNARITEAWACPIRRERQGARSKAVRAGGGTKHHTLEYKLRIKASAKKAYECPVLRKKMSDQKKAYWENWRRERHERIGSHQ